MPQWIRHRPTEPGIAGSSPAGVILFVPFLQTALHSDGMLPRGSQVCRKLRGQLFVQVFRTLRNCRPRTCAALPQSVVSKLSRKDCPAHLLFKGTWCSGITSASHAEGPGFKSQSVHFKFWRHPDAIQDPWAYIVFEKYSRRDSNLQSPP